MTYPGTYLKTPPFEERYKLVAEYLNPLIKEGTVVDINCGEPLFRKYIKHNRYVANDIFVPDSVEGVEFKHCTDTDVDVKPDILCVWGYGGGEHTGNDMESKTTTQTIVRLAKYEPEYIILEMAQKWENDFKIMSTLKEKLPDYDEVYAKKVEVPNASHYHDRRQFSVLKKKVL